jgi:hypothetical protein
MQLGLGGGKFRLVLPQIVMPPIAAIIPLNRCPLKGLKERQVANEKHNGSPEYAAPSLHPVAGYFTLERMKRIALVLSWISVVALFVWPSAGSLFPGPPTASVDLLGRAVAFTIVAVSYSVAIAALVYVSRRLTSTWASYWKVPVICSLAVAGSLLAPLATVPPLLLIKSVCTHPSYPCATPEFLSLVPHALHVASAYPTTQILVAAPALLLLLWLAQNASVNKASARPQHAL